ncbi:MAG: hypothetical protein HKM95_13855, partial [Inquilinus sp.]|nr:hypothetical protein [Inquilinus sp.]
FSSVFVIAAASNLNYGVRHILPVITLLCVGAGYGIARLWSTRHGVKRMAGVCLAAWQLVTPLAAHPDHLAYFNALAGSRPERVLILGDLDWGQDLERLAHVLDRLGVESFHLLYLGSAEPSRHGLPDFNELDPAAADTRGWIVTHLRASERLAEPLSWLTEHQPVTTAGRTFRIYYIE